MPDDRVYDAINLFKYSQTGQGTARVGGDAAYRDRYRSLARDVLSKLWELWSAGEIGFARMRAIGDSLADRRGPDIRVNRVLEPSRSTATYATAAEQGKLAAVSGNLVHEATHLVRHVSSYPEEEVLCRTIQLFYFRELRAGRSYHSRVTGTQCTAKYLPTTAYYADYQRRLNRLASHDLIDSVFAIATYRSDLESAQTADFIARSLPWWGGLRNRWPSTRGYYLRSLASQDHDYAHAILEILESLDRSQWPAAQSCAGDPWKIERGLMAAHHIYNNPFTNRIVAVQERLGEYFAIRSPGR